MLLSYGKLGKWTDAHKSEDSWSGYILSQEDVNSEHILLKTVPTILQNFLPLHVKIAQNKYVRGIIYINGSDDYLYEGGEIADDLPVCLVTKGDGDKILKMISSREEENLYCRIYSSSTLFKRRLGKY